MKKKIILVVLAVFAAVVTIFAAIFADRGDIKHVTEKIGDSELYTAEDVEKAMMAVEKEFKRSFRNCTLIKIWYDENVCKLEQEKWTRQYQKDEAIILLSDFKTGKSGIEHSLDPGNTYKNWEWILVRDTDGEWEIKTWGY